MAELYSVNVVDKFGDELVGYVGEYQPGTPQIKAAFTPVKK